MSANKQKWGVEGMAAVEVNLDALIKREDFAAGGAPAPGTLDTTIGIHHLTGYWIETLRKPDFQRETAGWKPEKIVDLVAAFLDGDLVPAIILWRSGQHTFVIDGAHRLSAMLAWIHDDYGDRTQSLNFFDHQISDEQSKIAEKTRAAVNKHIMPYATYAAMVKDIFSAPVEYRKRLGNFAQNAFVAQWVPAVDANSAQDSFFKINQAATPLDPTERRLLLHRHSAVAIATRAINRRGAGHPYWRGFDAPIQRQIEGLGAEIHDALYMPPLGGAQIKSSDVPVAGRGYSALPFLFDLVSLVNGVGIKDSTTTDKVVDKLQNDENGSLTVEYLQKVWRKISRITTNEPGSLGLHPLVYFYTRGGNFQPMALLSMIAVVDRLVQSKRLDAFTDIRCRFESFLMDHKEAVTLIVKKQGSGVRSRPAVEAFFELIMAQLWAGATDEQMMAALAADKRYYTLAAPAPIRAGADDAPRRFSTGVKTAAFVAELMTQGVRCAECGTLVHRNSMNTDHDVRRQDGGTAHTGNARITHPYCNTGYKERRVSQDLK